MTQLKDIDRALAEVLLDNVVNKRGNPTYKEIADELTLRLGREVNPHYHLSNPLGVVSTLCFELGLPLISARVIYSGATTSQAVGEGFYPFACDFRPEYKSMTPVDAWKHELSLMRGCKNWGRLRDYLDGVSIDIILSRKSLSETAAATPQSRIEAFAEWLSRSTKLAESSIGKYSGAVNTISKEMSAVGVITRPLAEMTPLEMDIAIASILHNKAFIEKNTRGNNMYSNALKQYRYFVHSLEEQLPEDSTLIEGIKEDSTIPETERAAIILSRVGQGLFRKALMTKYRGRCVITGIDHPKVLVASHIKPWIVSTNDERLSVDNGLLLSATYDRLFDCGLITFDKSGKIYLSSFIGGENIRRLQLTRNMHFDLHLTGDMERNLEYHSDVLFVK